MKPGLVSEGRRRARWPAALATVSAVVIAALAPAGASASAPASYTVSPLLGTNVSCVQTAADLNESGYVIGEGQFAGYSPSQDPVYAFAWHEGVFVQLPDGSVGSPVPGNGECGDSPNDRAWSISNEGAIVGETTDVRAYESNQAIWPSPTSSPVAASTGGACFFWEPRDIGDGGVILGEATSENGSTCTTKDNAPLDGALQSANGAAPAIVLAPSCVESSDIDADAMSANAQWVLASVSCSGEERRELWSSEGSTVSLTAAGLTPFVGSLEGVAQSLNDSGVVVGSAVVAGTRSPAYSVKGAAASVLPPPEGLTYGEAIAVDDDGDVVGYSAPPIAKSPREYAASLWPAAVAPASGPPPAAIDLNSLIPPSADVDLQQAISINDRQQILAVGETTTTPHKREYVVLNPGGVRISGKVTEPDDTPLAGEQLELTGTESATGLPVSEITTSAADGSYSFSVETGSYTVTAVQPSEPARGRFLVSECSGSAGPGSCQVTLDVDGEEGTADFRRDSLIVNSTETATNSSEAAQGVCDITPSAADQTCTLPQAIEAVNALPGGGATIGFDIPGGGVPQIRDPGGLPAIEKPVIVDASSQPESGKVELSGQAQASPVSKGLTVAAGGAGSAVTGMVINGYTDEVVLEGGGDTIQGDLLGTDPSGTGEEPNPLAASSLVGTQSHIAVRIASSGNQIGGAGAGQGNVIATGWTLDHGAIGAIDDVGGSYQNVIQGNSIGVRARSTARLLGTPPALSGLEEEAAVVLVGEETLGGAGAGQGNTIAPGGTIAGAAVFQGNTIVGSLYVAGKATIGGATGKPGTGAGNDFSDPDQDVVLLTIGSGGESPGFVQPPLGAPTSYVSPGGSGAVVQGNSFHDDSDGAIDVQATHVTVGGEQEDLGNLIRETASASASTSPGERLPAAVTIDTPHEAGYALVAENTLERNGNEGAVEVAHGDSDTIAANRMLDNPFGIVLGEDAGYAYNGAVAQSPGGPNDDEYYPELLDSELAAGGLKLSGRLAEPPARAVGLTDTIDLYGERSCAAQGVQPGEGEDFLGSATVSTARGYVKGFELDFKAPPDGQDAITATLTAPDGSTSELSPCLRIGERAASLASAGVKPVSSTVALSGASAADAGAARTAAAHKKGGHARARGTIELLCPVRTPGGCAGTFVLATSGRHPTTLVRKRFDIKPGFVKAIVIAVGSRTLAKLIKTHRLHARARISAHDRAKHRHRRTTRTNVTLVYE